MPTYFRTEWSADHKAELGVVEHDGHEYSALGSLVSDTYAIGYVKLKDFNVCTITSWNGTVLGYGHVVSKWPIHSYLSSHMYQIRATIAGVTYTGRSLGNGMLWRGRKVKAK